MLRTSMFWIAIAAASELTGCALSDPSSTASILPAAAASTSSQSGYVLSAGEQALECKKLTGRMQIRILEIRDYNERNQASFVSQTLHSGMATVTGKGAAGSDPSGQYAKDRAMLEAYNNQLAAKGCKTYDLDAELQPKHYTDTPTPNIKPAGGPAPADGK